MKKGNANAIVSLRLEVIKNMKRLKISDAQISRYCAHPLKNIRGWLKGENELPYTIVWSILELLELS